MAISSSFSTDIRAVEAVRPSSNDRVQAKSKATALDQTVIPTAKKERRFGLVGKETTLEPISNRYSTEEDEESLFLSAAPSHFGSQPASSHGQVVGSIRGTRKISRSSRSPQ